MGKSKEIVIESIDRMQLRLIALKQLIEEYVEKNKDYIPTFEFLDYLGQVESTINYLISMAELSNTIENKKQQKRKILTGYNDESGAYV